LPTSATSLHLRLFATSNFYYSVNATFKKIERTAADAACRAQGVSRQRGQSTITHCAKAPKLPNQISNMIGDWDDLTYNKNPDHKEYDEIKAWLRSQTQNLETTVSNTSHPLELLRAALRSAIYEIRDNFDKQISLLVVEAGQHNIQVQQGDYYTTRTDDWDGMLPTDIDEMGVEECVGLMRAAREEIAWLHNEISRLECYISVEKQMERHGIQGRSTALRPLQRKSEKQDKTTEGEKVMPLEGTGIDSVFDLSPTSPAVG
jgi:hypothetical protein